MNDGCVISQEPEPEKTEEKESEVKDKLPKEIAESPSAVENCRFTRSMARTSETGTSLSDLLI